MRIRFAVIADPHGNAEGLSAVLRHIKRRDIKDIVCLGDVVGYGAEPELCWKLVKEKCKVSLKGNHEAMLLGEMDDSHCSRIGKQSSAWTTEHISAETKKELAGSPMCAELYGALFLHSAPEGSGMWDYLNKTEQITESFRGCSQPLIFYGHTHRPRVTLVGADGTVLTDKLIDATESFTTDLSSCRCYVNPGSAGQQRDAHTDVSYAVCELNGDIAKITVCRIGYRRLKSYLNVKYHGCGPETATYLIREKWRRDLFEVIDNRCPWLRGKSSNQRT